MRRSLKHYWRIHVAVLLAAATATAVLTGALLVGDSVRGSLRDLTLDRLGGIDYAVLTENLFRAELCDEVAAQSAYREKFEAPVAALLLTGTASHAASQTRATNVNISGVEENFFALFPANEPDALSHPLKRKTGQPFQSIIINAALQQELNAKLGDQILLSFKGYSEIPRASLLGNKEAEEVLETLRLTITHVLPNRGLGRFGLRPGQHLPLNAFVSLPVLQRGLAQEGRVNAMLIATRSEKQNESAVLPNIKLAAFMQPELIPRPLLPDNGIYDLKRKEEKSLLRRREVFSFTKENAFHPKLRLPFLFPREGGRGDEFGLTSMSFVQPSPPSTRAISGEANATEEDTTKLLSQTLQSSWQLEDLGLLLQTHENFFSLASRSLILKPSLVQLAQKLAAEQNLPAQTILTYLANTMRLRERMIPYSTITALQTPVPPPFGNLLLHDNALAPQLNDDEVLLNEWAARELAASLGDTIAVSYYVVGAREELTTQTHALRVQGVVQQTGLANDRSLTPPIPGVENADDMQAWEPPFPVDFDLIREQDEVYWDEHGATPKAFVNESTGRRLWRNRFGEVSAQRIGIHDSTARAEFEKKILAAITPEEAGFNLQAVKTQGLQSAVGATDFGMLFLGFSFFLIIAATLLLGMLFRLGVEQRVREVGTLLAMGFTLRAVRRRLFKEGFVVALAGTLLGTFAGLGYAWLMMIGLRTWWVEAVGTSFLFLHVEGMSLLLGAVCALAIIAFAIWWSVRQFGKIPATALLHGVTQREEVSATRSARRMALGASVGAALLFLLALFMDANSSVGLFFGGGALLLIAGLAFLSLRLRRRSSTIVAHLLAMSARNNARHPSRSLLSAALVSCACFIIVAVAANRRESGEGASAKDSGTGGFALLAQTDAPLYHNLASASGRAALGFAEEDSALFHQTKIFPLRLLPGEDASCLNLYQPQKPRVLGVTREQITRGGFLFQATTNDSTQNPWTLLETELEPNVIPAIGDFNSVQWILHLGLGKDIVMPNEAGEEIKLRFVGLLQSSVLQSEALISEENFLKHFPSQSGYAFFLIEANPDSAARLSQKLESALRRFGFDATSTREKLASFQAVENTYLSVFQTLGGLGLLLGTLGLGLVLMRNVIERRGELATLRAFGFLQSFLMKMLLAENGFLLLWGIVIGSVAALLAVTPHLLRAGSSLPWLSLSMTLALVFLTGLAASAIALKAALRAELLPALKAE